MVSCASLCFSVSRFASVCFFDWFTTPCCGAAAHCLRLSMPSLPPGAGPWGGASVPRRAVLCRAVLRAWLVALCDSFLCSCGGEVVVVPCAMRCGAALALGRTTTSSTTRLCRTTKDSRCCPACPFWWLRLSSSDTRHCLWVRCSGAVLLLVRQCETLNSGVSWD